MAVAAIDVQLPVGMVMHRARGTRTRQNSNNEDEGKDTEHGEEIVDLPAGRGVGGGGGWKKTKQNAYSESDNDFCMLGPH